MVVIALFTFSWVMLTCSCLVAIPSLLFDIMTGGLGLSVVITTLGTEGFISSFLIYFFMVKKNNSNQLCLLSKLHSSLGKWDKVCECISIREKHHLRNEITPLYRPSYSLSSMLSEQSAFKVSNILR